VDGEGEEVFDRNDRIYWIRGEDEVFFQPPRTGG